MKTYRLGLLLTFIITVLSFTTYAALQYHVRESANEQLVQIADEGARLLKSGQDPSQLAPQSQIPVKESLSPFVIVYSPQKQVAGSSAELNGNTPQLPTKVLDNMPSSGDKRITWQPESGVRLATVIKKADDKGYVLAGRSLRETERQITMITQLMIMGWLAGVAGIAVLLVAFRWQEVRLNKGTATALPRPKFKLLSKLPRKKSSKPKTKPGKGKKPKSA